MNTKLLFASILTAGLAASATAAHAETVQIGAQAQVLPVGTLTLDGPGDAIDSDTDTEVAFGLVGTADYPVHPNISIGAAPRLILNVKGDGADDSATQLDLAFRVTGHFPVAPKADLFVYASPAYSFIFLPDSDSDVEIDDPSGLALGFGAGGAFKLSPTLSLVGELGYTLGFQGVEVGGETVDITSDFLHLGVGIKAAI